MTAAPSPPPLPNEPEPFARFITERLMQPVDPSPGAPLAVTETELPVDGDRWFWADDNAKALELLTLPSLWPSVAGPGRDSFRFLASLCRGPFIFRRTSHPRLEERQRDATGASFTHGFLSIRADHPRGLVTVGMRFHDGRDTESLYMANHRIRFRAGGTRHDVTVAAAERGAVEHRGAELLITHQAEVTFRSWGRTKRLGRLTVLHRFRADAAAFEVEARLEVDAASGASDIGILLACDDLNHGKSGVTDIFYDAVHGLREDGRPLMGLSGRREAWIPGGRGAQYWCASQEAMMRGFALAIHCLPREPGRIAGLRMVPASIHTLGWLAAEHRFEGSQAGATLVAAERRLITSGGFYNHPDEYAALMRDDALVAGGRVTDISISYDYGAELVAFARIVRLLSGAGPPDPAMREEAQALYDRLLAVFRDRMLGAERLRPGSVFSRPLSFVVQSLCDMVLATGEARYHEALEEAAEVLLDFGREQTDVAGRPNLVFLMGQKAPAAHLDCQSAAILALARAAPLLTEALRARAVEAADRAMGAFAIATVAVDLGGPKLQDLVTVEHVAGGGRQHYNGFWNFSVALALRAFRALARSADPGMREVSARHAERVSLLRTLIQRQFRASLRPLGDAVEVRTSVLSAETNSETQPWVALALVRQPGDW